MPRLSKESSKSAPAKPLIGILSGILVSESGPMPGMERSYVNHDYIAAVEAAGGVPLMIPVAGDDEVVRRQVEAVDAIILSGGYDPSPLLYGENPVREIGFIFPEMDAHQLKAIRAAAALGMPIMGICRGLQMINVAFGGSLYQDLTLIPNSYIQHYQKSRKHSPGHQVVVEKGTILAEVFGESVIQTNSFHHLAVKDLAPGFIVSARAPDGVVEGIERRGAGPGGPGPGGAGDRGGTVLAVQWHPEMMHEKDPAMLDLFRKFIAMARG